MPDKYSASFIDGMNAFRSGYSVHANPYRNNGIEHSSEHSDWEDGWSAAKEHSDLADIIVQYQNPWFMVEKQKGMHWVSPTNPGGAVIIPVTKDQKVLCVEVFRPSINMFSLEFPRGGAEKGAELSVLIAKRELYEETGAKVPESRFFLIGTVVSDTGVIGSRIPVFMALVEDGDITGEPDAEIASVVPLSWAEIFQNIQSGKITCGFTLSSISLFHADRLLRGLP